MKFLLEQINYYSVISSEDNTAVKVLKLLLYICIFLFLRLEFIPLVYSLVYSHLTGISIKDLGKVFVTYLFLASLINMVKFMLGMLIICCKLMYMSCSPLFDFMSEHRTNKTKSTLVNRVALMFPDIKRFAVDCTMYSTVSDYAKKECLTIINVVLTAAYMILQGLTR